MGRRSPSFTRHALQAGSTSDETERDRDSDLTLQSADSSDALRGKSAGLASNSFFFSPPERGPGRGQGVARSWTDLGPILDQASSSKRAAPRASSPGFAPISAVP